MANEKYFHISDILTFYTGAMITSQNEMTAPDGSVRPAAWSNKMAPILEIAGQVTGESFWLDKKTAEYDGMRLAFQVEGIRDELAKQLPWLKDYRKAPKAPGGSQDDVAKFYADWVAGVAATVGGEWFKLQTEQPATPAATKAPRGPRAA